MKTTMAIKMLEGKDKSRTFVLYQPPTERMLKIKKFEAGIAEAVFLEKEKDEDLKSQLKMIAGYFYPRSNVGVSFQHFFKTQQPLKEIHLVVDGITIKVSKANMDVVRLQKQFKQMEIEQEKLKARQKELMLQKKRERREKRARWIRGVRK